MQRFEVVGAIYVAIYYVLTQSTDRGFKLRHGIYRVIAVKYEQGTQLAVVDAVFARDRTQTARDKRDVALAR